MKNKIQRLKKKYRYSIILLKEFVRTDFKIRYQNSVLGYAWAALRPIFMFIILYVVFVYFLRVGRGIPNWPVAMLLGIVMWNFFTEVTNQSLKAVVSKSKLIRKINFPKYLIILSASVSSLINMGINLAVVMVFILISGVEIGWSILITPIYFVEIYFFAIGVAFILSTLYVKYRDISYFWEIIVQALFYLSAILYPITLLTERGGLYEQVASVIMLSPITSSIQGARNTLINSDLPTTSMVLGNWAYGLIPVCIIAFTVLIGGWYFRKNSPMFAEEA